MIEPYMIGLWIGTLSFAFIFCMIMDMVTVPKDDAVITYQDRPFELEENISEPSSIYVSDYNDDYDNIDSMINED